ncbi:MAG: hypothetical protein U9O87_02825 [Verrucomicrobiota bacterium]|nr:hypothetical protein [Verrucomicrobiota bacterium]
MKTKRNPHIEGPSKLLYPEKTFIVECRTSRSQCWPDASKSKKLLPVLHKFKEQLKEIKKKIRHEEPKLKRDDTLFEEFAEWDYEKSRNHNYLRLIREIKKTEHSIYHGSFFEQINNAKLADYLYLAVPAGLVHPYELADGWGLLWVYDDTYIQEMLPPEFKDCMNDNKYHLVQNIAASNKKHILFQLGVDIKDDKTYFLPKPRKKKKSYKYKI